MTNSFNLFEISDVSLSYLNTFKNELYESKQKIKELIKLNDDKIRKLKNEVYINANNYKLLMLKLKLQKQMYTVIQEHQTIMNELCQL